MVDQSRAESRTEFEHRSRLYVIPKQAPPRTLNGVLHAYEKRWIIKRRGLLGGTSGGPMCPTLLHHFDYGLYRDEHRKSVGCARRVSRETAEDMKTIIQRSF